MEPSSFSSRRNLKVPDEGNKHGSDAMENTRSESPSVTSPVASTGSSKPPKVKLGAHRPTGYCCFIFTLLVPVVSQIVAEDNYEEIEMDMAYSDSDLPAAAEVNAYGRNSDG